MVITNFEIIVKLTNKIKKLRNNAHQLLRLQAIGFVINLVFKNKKFRKKFFNITC